MSLTRFACVCHEGRTHTTNDDRWYADADQGLFFVADGMANSIAPAEVVRLLPPALASILAQAQEPADWPAQLRSVLAQLNRQVRETMRSSGERGIGTTLVLALVRGAGAWIAHLGDSRAYLFRGGRLTPLTRDHSYMQELLDRGVLDAEDVDSAEFNGGPSRFLGMETEAVADVQAVGLTAGDRLLLCSDGLTAMLSEQEIEAILAGNEDLPECCQRLIDAANAAGGLDNITALLIEAHRG